MQLKKYEPESLHTGKKSNTLNMKGRLKRLGIEQAPPDDPVYKTGPTIQIVKNLMSSAREY